LNAADIPKGNKDKRQKNDKRDARNISEEIKKKEVGIYVPSIDGEYGRRTREQQITDSTRMKARIWQFLYFHALAAPQKEDGASTGAEGLLKSWKPIIVIIMGNFRILPCKCINR
jgi:hypothetical protein